MYVFVQVMPPRKRARRNPPSTLHEDRPGDVDNNQLPNPHPPLDIATLSASISTAVSEAIQRALQGDQQGQHGVRDTIRENANVISGGHDASGQSEEPLTPIFSSIAIPLGGNVSDKLKAKIWADEFVHFSALLEPSVNQSRYAVNLSPAQGDKQASLTFEQHHAAKKIVSINQWITAFNIFAAIKCQTKPRESVNLFKYCEIVRDIAAKMGDWAMYDEQFRYLRQSAPERFPWEAVHWELWLKATTTFRASKPTTNFRASKQSRQSFGQGTCWSFNAGKFCGGCKYAHKCSNCGAKHAASQCNSSSVGTEQRGASQRVGQGASTTAVKESTGNSRKSGAS